MQLDRGLLCTPLAADSRPGPEVAAEGGTAGWGVRPLAADFGPGGPGPEASAEGDAA